VSWGFRSRETLLNAAKPFTVPEISRLDNAVLLASSVFKAVP
jgi:hypothetical protein